MPRSSSWLILIVGLYKTVNLKRQLHIDWSAWIAISVLLFISAWFIPFEGKWAGLNGWSLWHATFKADTAFGVAFGIVMLALYSGLYLVPSVLIGWILQYFVGMVRALWKERGR